jgi:hypothetical protein
MQSVNTVLAYLCLWLARSPILRPHLWYTLSYSIFEHLEPLQLKARPPRMASVDAYVTEFDL